MGRVGFLINFYDYIIHKLCVIIIFIKKYKMFSHYIKNFIKLKLI